MSLNSAGKKILGIHVGAKKVILKFNDGKLDVMPNTYTECHLFVGKELSEADIKNIKALNELDVYLNYAKKLCLAKSRSEKFIEEKLSQKGAKARQIGLIIKELKKYSLIDDAVLIKELLELSEYKHYGHNKVVALLKDKGITKEDILKLKFDDEKELAQAKAMLPSLEKKFGKYNFLNKKNHIYNALVRNGFDYDIAKQAIEYIDGKDLKHELEVLKLDYQKAYRKYVKKFAKDEAVEKTTDYLIAKGYRYNDIEKIKGEK